MVHSSVWAVSGLLKRVNVSDSNDASSEVQQEQAQTAPTMIMPGDVLDAEITLRQQMPLEKGQLLTIRENQKTVLTGLFK